MPITFRMYALGIRFVFVFALAYFLDPSSVGLYGLFASFIAYVVYALGIDLYTFTTREVIVADPIRRRRQIRSHFTMLALVACVVVPLMIFFFVTGALPWATLPWFILIAVSEHAGFEIDRLLVALGQQFAASLVILIRQAALPTIAIPLFIFDPGLRSLDLVLALWFTFNLLAVLVGIMLIARHTPIGESGIDWSWIRKGVLVALPFLAGTLCLRLIFTADRQIVAVFDGLEVLAAYTLAITVANGMSSLLTVGLHQFMQPVLVKAAALGDRALFQATARSMWIQTSVVVAAGVVVASATHGWITGLLGKPVYQEWSWLIPLSVAALGVYNLSLIPHYELYALRADRQILRATVGALVVFAVAVGVAISMGVSAAVSATVAIALASLLLLATKGVWLARALRHHSWTIADS